MPTFRLAQSDGLGWIETLAVKSSRDRCYQAARKLGPGAYLIVVDWVDHDPVHREVRVNDDLTVHYRIPGADNWHKFWPID